MDKMKISMDEAVKKAKEEMFSLTKLEKISGGPSSDVIKLDSKSVMDFVDKQDNDKLRFNFDVDEFESESISVKAVGNQIEVHGKKSVKKGDDETNEEFSRTYEMPTDGSIDSDKITTSIFKDGVLSVELPFDTKALKDKQ
jgi:HSP20 family molecular chaperone IbpA